MIRLHLDEHVDPAIARGLRERGIDVTTAAEVELLSARDEEHVAYALASQRVIYTNDADYLRIAAMGSEHAGIAYCPPNSRTVGQIIRFLALLSDVSDSTQMRNRIEYL